MTPVELYTEVHGLTLGRTKTPRTPNGNDPTAVEMGLLARELAEDGTDPEVVAEAFRDIAADRTKAVWSWEKLLRAKVAHAGRVRRSTQGRTA